MNERGFTLLETAVTAAVALVLLGAAAYGWSATRSGSAAASAALFDAEAGRAQAAAAASGDGATLTVESAASGAGAVLRLYAGRPDGLASPVADGAPVGLSASVQVDGGSPPAALLFESSGGVRPALGYPDATGLRALSAEPACPPGGAVVLAFTDGTATARRTLAC